MKALRILSDSIALSTEAISKTPSPRHARPLSVGDMVEGRRGNRFGLHRGHITASRAVNDFVRGSECVAPRARNHGDRIQCSLSRIAEFVISPVGQGILHERTRVSSSSNRLQPYLIAFPLAPAARNLERQRPLHEGQLRLHRQTTMNGSSNWLQRYTTEFSVAPGARNFHCDFDRESPLHLPHRKGKWFDTYKRSIPVLRACHMGLALVHALPLWAFGLPQVVCRFRALGARKLMRWKLDIQLLDAATPFCVGVFTCPSGGASASDRINC